MISAAAATAALAVAAAAQAGVNFVQDGDFFPTPAVGPNFATYAGGSSFGPWTVTGNSVDLIGGYWQSPTPGGGSVDLDGDAPGGIRQSLGVLNAGSYDLKFYMSGNPDGAPSLKTLDVGVGGVSETLHPGRGQSRSNMDYVLETIGFTSDGVHPTILSFTSGDVNTPFGPVIGGVSVAAIPEPATWAMLILGVGLIGIAARRRRQGLACAG
jgi:choice-of-anchor C domain-containing protein